MNHCPQRFGGRFVELANLELPGLLHRRAQLQQPQQVAGRTARAAHRLRGLGLGLVISRDIVAEFGGELSLEPAPGGARFVMSLPKARS